MTIPDTDCSGCYYALPIINQDGVLLTKCRRFPPQIHTDEDGDPAQGFPDAWRRCGEYRDNNTVQTVSTIINDIFRRAEDEYDTGGST